MRTQQTTAKNYFSSHATLSQLAKNSSLPTKTNDSKLFEAKTPVLKKPRTLTHAQGKLQKNIHEPNPQKVHGLSPRFQTKFLNLVPLMFTKQPVKVVYHNKDYVQQILTTYNQKIAILFLNWVEAFCIIRREYRHELTVGIYQTHEEDFADTFTLFKQQEMPYATFKPIKKELALWNVIETHFSSKVFNYHDLKPFCTLKEPFIITGLRKLLINDKLRVHHFVHGLRYYEIY